MRFFSHFMAVMVLFGMFSASHAQAEEALNLLFFGNSFTKGNDGKDVPSIVGKIAEAAGHPAPTVVRQANDGWSLNDQINKVNSDGNGSVIQGSLAPGQNWDAFVIQGYSTEATHLGNVSGFRNNAVTLSGLVRNHSSGAVPVLFETWARAQGHSFYPDSFADPLAMQQEVAEGYSLAQGDINTAIGQTIARFAPVGDGFASGNWASDLYNSDLYHANNRGSLLAGLVLYATIYRGSPLPGIDELGSVLSYLNLDSSDGLAMLELAGTVVPEPSAIMVLLVGAGALLARRRQG